MQSDIEFLEMDVCFCLMDFFAEKFYMVFFRIIIVCALKKLYKVVFEVKCYFDFFFSVLASCFSFLDCERWGGGRGRVRREG